MCSVNSTVIGLCLQGSYYTISDSSAVVGALVNGLRQV